MICAPSPPCRIKVTCPVASCARGWESQDLPIELAASLNTALQIHSSTVHAVTYVTPAATWQQHPKVKLDPPKIDLNCDPDQWSSFKRQWNMYKAGMAIPQDMVATALFNCSHDHLRTYIMRDVQGNIPAMSEDVLLGHIKCLAIQEESILVQRIKLSKMSQSTGTGIRTFLTSLRGQAVLCQYTARCKETGCTHIFDYSEDIIKDNLIRGIADSEIMADLLGDSKTDHTLEETVIHCPKGTRKGNTTCCWGPSGSDGSHS